jgi:NAD(P)-dependent dehydrogenase (short-subunit alcohol dehydrogenase family)
MRNNQLHRLGGRFSVASMSTSLTGTCQRLSGKSAVITGAAAGIGGGVARRFAREGARLVLADVNPSGLEELAGSIAGTAADIVTVTADVSNPEDAAKITAVAVEHYGRLDIAVVNAGISRSGSIVEATVDDWDAVMAVQARGMFLTSKYAIGQMAANGGGAVVFTSSISGIAGHGGQAVYGPAKFVASGLAKHLAVEWAGRGIRVNAVAPGTVNTERLQEIAAQGPDGAEFVAGLAAQHPMGRLAELAEVAAAVLFLASDEASFITGAILPVDGGFLAQ